MATAETTATIELGGDSQLAAEHALIRRCQQGDWSQYGQLVERYRRLVWSAVDAAIDDQSQIEDVVQEVFVRVYEKLHLFAFRSSFSSWLWRLARNHALQVRRKSSRRGGWLSLSVKPDGTQRELPGDRSPEHGYVSESREAAMATLLHKLPEEQRSILNLYYMGEHTYEEIAALTGMPLNTVSTRLRRAKLRLQELARGAGWDMETAE